MAYLAAFCDSATVPHGRDHPLDLVPPRSQCPLSQPLADFQASLEFAQRPVVGKPSITSMLTEQGLLLRFRLQRQ